MVPLSEDEKALRRVRTREGVEHYGQGLGTIIEADRLSHVTPDKITRSDPLSGGRVATTVPFTTPDGHKGISKTMDDDNIIGLSARHQADAEYLVSLVGRATGAKVPMVYQVQEPEEEGTTEIWMNRVPGIPAIASGSAEHQDPDRLIHVNERGGEHYVYDMRPGRNPPGGFRFAEGWQAARKKAEMIEAERRTRSDAASDDERLLGLVDLLTFNADRNRGNWMITDEGDVVGIDHGGAFAATRSDGRQVLGVGEIDGVGWPRVLGWFSEHFYAPKEDPSSSRRQLNPENDMSPRDMELIERALGDIRNEFILLGRQDWHDDMMARFWQLKERARGIVDRLYDHDEQNEKSLRRVRSLPGMRRFHKPIGAIIEEGPSQAGGRSHHELPEVRRRATLGMWGGSHGGSYGMTGESAAIMGLTGFRRTARDEGGGVRDQYLQAYALNLLKIIASGAERSRARRFHGTQGRQWADVKVGQELDLPLTATTPHQSYASGYGNDRSANADKARSYMIVFPKGVHAAGIGHDKDPDTDEKFDWDEMVVAGRFRVARVSESTFGGYTRIELEPTGVFDPTHRVMRPLAKKPKMERERSDIEAELLDVGARVHDDGTVSIWPTVNINRQDMTAGRHIDWTTNRREAAQRAEWNQNSPPVVERRVPIKDITITDQYDDSEIGAEARVRFEGDQELDEEKSMRLARVATRGGAIKYGQPIGSVIVRDVVQQAGAEYKGKAALRAATARLSDRPRKKMGSMLDTHATLTMTASGQDWSDKAQEASARALRFYRNSTYKKIGQHLREPNSIEPTFKIREDMDSPETAEYLDDHVVLIDQVMEDSPLRRPVELWRGLFQPEKVFGSAWETRASMVDAEWIEHSFVSTSAAESVARSFGSGALMRLHVPAGIGAVQLDRWPGEYPYQTAEAELLLDRRLRMRVVADTEEQMGTSTQWRTGPNGEQIKTVVPNMKRVLDVVVEKIPEDEDEFAKPPVATDIHPPRPGARFEVLPEDKRGSSGDGRLAQGAPWGRFGAAGMLVRNVDDDGVSRFLVLKTGQGTDAGGKWQLPGGAMDENENPYQGAARELVEEGGIDPGILSGFGAVGEHVLSHEKTGWSYTTLLADSPTQFHLNVDGRETKDHFWLTRDEVAEMVEYDMLQPDLATTILALIDYYEEAA